MSDYLWYVVAWLGVMTFMTASAFARDKHAAGTGAWRTRERSLWILVLAGGVIGGWIGMLVMRHKTRHMTFWVVQWVATALWGGLVLYLLLA